jgi:hypothetical protein
LKVTIDGRLDRPAFTAEEVQDSLQEDSEKMDYLAQSLMGDDEDSV